MAAADLAGAIQSIGRGPCPGCVNYIRCCNDDIACQAYLAWTEGVRVWPYHKREPNHGIYHLIFTSESTTEEPCT